MEVPTAPAKPAAPKFPSPARLTPPTKLAPPTQKPAPAPTLVKAPAPSKQAPLPRPPAAAKPLSVPSPPVPKKTPFAASASSTFNKYGFLEDVQDANHRRREHPDYDPSTLYIPLMYMNKFTAFEKQYWEIKKQYFDTVVFFRKGKFYELFETDADIGVAELGLRLSARVSMKMAGMPASAFDQYAAKLLAKG